MQHRYDLLYYEPLHPLVFYCIKLYVILQQGGLWKQGYSI